MDCSLPGSSVHRIFQARILEWVAISFSRGSSWSKDWTRASHIAGRYLITEPSGKPTEEPGMLLNILCCTRQPLWIQQKYPKYQWYQGWETLDIHSVYVLKRKQQCAYYLSLWQEINMVINALIPYYVFIHSCYSFGFYEAKNPQSSFPWLITLKPHVSYIFNFFFFKQDMKFYI